MHDLAIHVENKNRPQGNIEHPNIARIHLQKNTEISHNVTIFFGKISIFSFPRFAWEREKSKAGGQRPPYETTNNKHDALPANGSCIALGGLFQTPLYHLHPWRRRSLAPGVILPPTSCRRTFCDPRQSLRQHLLHANYFW